MSFAITLYCQCCQLHVVGQQVVIGIGVIRIVVEIFVCVQICIWFSNDTNMLLRTPAHWYTCSVYFASKTQHTLQNGGMYLVTMDTKFSDVTAPHLHNNDKLPVTNMNAFTCDILLGQA